VIPVLHQLRKREKRYTSIQMDLPQPMILQVLLRTSGLPITWEAADGAFLKSFPKVRITISLSTHWC